MLLLSDFTAEPDCNDFMGDFEDKSLGEIPEDLLWHLEIVSVQTIFVLDNSPVKPTENSTVMVSLQTG